MTVGQRIKERRIELGLSADQLAEKIGKNRSTIYRYENGDIENMPLDLLEPIAIALNTYPAYLLWGENVDWKPETQEISIDDSIMDKKYNQLIERMRGNKTFEEIIFEYAEMMYKRFEKED